MHPASSLSILHLPRPSRLGQYVSSLLRPLDIDLNAIHEFLGYYGLKLIAPPQNLPIGRRGRSVALQTSAGKKVLRLYRAQWQTGTVLYEHSILNRLAQLNFPAIRLATALHGKTFINLAGRYYALFEFAEGVNYSSNYLLRAHRLKLMAMAGQTLARLHQQLAGFMPEGSHHLGFSSYTDGRRRDFAWHVEKVNELMDRSRALTDTEGKFHADWMIQHKNYVLEEIGRLDETLRAAHLPRLIIHGDYGLHNLLFQKGGPVMPLDFELARLEWRLSDLVSCLSRFQYSTGTYDFESIRWFMEAYQAELPLGASEWRLLPQVWRFYKLQGAVQYWNSYFETNGPTRKLVSAHDAVKQADWALAHQNELLALNPQALTSAENRLN